MRRDARSGRLTAREPHIETGTHSAFGLARDFAIEHAPRIGD
jgi:hypothetical protein